MVCSNRSIPGLLCVLNNITAAGLAALGSLNSHTSNGISAYEEVSLGALGAASWDRGVADLITAQPSIT